MEKEGTRSFFNSQDGRVNTLLLFVILFIFTLTVYFVESVVPLEFPTNNTNASARFGFAAAGINVTYFNATNPQFKCNVTSLNATTYNVTRVTLFINRSSNSSDMLVNTTSVINATQHLNHSVAENAQEIVIFNVSTAFDEGTYAWMCQQEDNATTKTINQSGTNFFIIDKSAPAIAKINVSSNTTVFNTTSSSTKLSTGDFVRIAANFTDAFTTIHTVRLFVNFSGVANNEVNITGGTSGVEADNATIVNLTTTIPGNSSIAMGTVLNFTLQVNDSVGNVNITQALIFTIGGDGTPPDPINLTYPINLFNQSSATAPIFNFTAFDNNDTNINCNISLTVGGSFFANISNLNVTSGAAHQNTTTVSLINGTYTWNVTCIDGPGNANTSIGRTFTVDQIPPVFDYYNFTNSSNASYQLGNGGNSSAQGRTLFALANFTDNLTQPLQGALQFFNITSVSWQTLSTSPSNYKASENSSWINLSFTPPAGRNEFEGRNVSFRLIANDTLGNSHILNMTVKNFTIQINDTFAPTVSINGTVSVNGSSLTNTAPLVSWVVNENNALRSINISVDARLPVGTGFDGCRAAFYDTSSGANNVDRNRNGSFTVDASDASCRLGNGTHSINVTTFDSWGNKIVFEHVFTVSTITAPTSAFNLTNENGGIWSKGIAYVDTPNITSNITSKSGITLFGTKGLATANIDKIKYVSSCNSSSTVVVNNGTIVFPFNESGCNTASANRTLTLTINDTAGNSNTTIYSFLVDNVVPTLTVNNPTNGQTFDNVNATFNVTVLDSNQALHFIGYYLDENDAVLNTLNATGNLGGAGISTTSASFRNHTGTHKVKFTANDSLGNFVNSSLITFTMISPINMLGVNQTIRGNNVNISNLSIFNQSGGLISDSSTPIAINQTFELFALDNGSVSNLNLTVTINFNGSAANWNATNEIFFIVSNRSDTPIERHLRNNQTALVNRSLFINSSGFSKFLNNNNSYFGKVRFGRLNISNLSAAGTLGGRHNLWFFPDHNDMNTKTNISECPAGFSQTHAGTTVCWNNTDNMSVDIYVPHFSVVVFAENSEAPTINVTTPESNSNQTVSIFVPNITVSADAVLCEYSINSTVTKYVMTKSGNICLGQTERFKNLMAVPGYSFIFNVTDTGGNVNTYNFTFNVTDRTSPNSGIITSSPSTTSATVTATGVNETVNATVIYGSVNTTLSGTAMETDFNTTQAVSITGLTASTTYYYNITVCDFNGNCKGNGTFSFATSAAAAAAAAAAASSSSGGGGAAAPSNEAASASRRWDSLAVGSSAVLAINNENIAVTGVLVDVKNAVSNAELKVASLNSNPLSTAAAAKAYQYLQITRSNIADIDTSKITINFRVPKSWLASNNVGEDDVILYRYSDNKWNALATTKTGADANNVLYSATTPGFSTFAVGSKEAAPVAAPPEEVPSEAPPTTEAPPTEAVPPAEAPEVMEKKGLSNTAIAWIVVAIIVIVAGVGYYMWQKKKAE